MIDNEVEKEEAQQYLLLWKKFLLRRLQGEGFEVKMLDEEWRYREAHLDGILCQFDSMALTLAVNIKFNYEIE